MTGETLCILEAHTPHKGNGYRRMSEAVSREP